MRSILVRTSRTFALTLLLLIGAPCAVVSGPVSTAAPIVLSAHLRGDALWSAAEFLNDPRGSFDIDDVSRGSARAGFAPFPAALSADRIVKGWFRFSLRAPADQAGLWALVADLPCDTFDVYYGRTNGTYGVIHAGMMVPLAQRDHGTPYPTVPLSASMTNGSPLYAYIVMNQSLEVDTDFLSIATLASTRADYQHQRLIDTFFGGLFFAILISNAFLGLYLRDRTFLVYVIAMALHVLTQFTQDGTAWMLFWPTLAVPYGPASVIVEACFLASLPLFWRTFLNLATRSPALDRLLLALVGISTLRAVLLLTLPQTGWLSLADFPVAYALIVTALIAAFGAARSGYRPARFLIVALAGLLVFWGFAYPVEFLASLPPGLLGNLVANGIYYGVAWDALFLTFALADRIETANRGMIAAQNDVLTAQRETVERLQERDTAVTRFLPREFLQHLGRETVVDLQLGDHVEREMTILFSDIRSFTTLSESMTAEQTFGFLNAYLRRAGPIIRAHDGFIDKYIGDALMALFPNDARTAIDAAIAMQRSVFEHNRERARAGDAPIAIGIGLHRGSLMLGAIGESERIETTVIADAVNIAARTESLTKQFRAPLIATAAVVDALSAPHDYRMRPLGEVVVLGASRGTRLFQLLDGEPPDRLLDQIATLDAFTAGVAAFAAGRLDEARNAFGNVLERAPGDETAAYLEEQCRIAGTTPTMPWDGRIHQVIK